jgi:hypothetical protein
MNYSGSKRQLLRNSVAAVVAAIAILISGLTDVVGSTSRGLADTQLALTEGPCRSTRNPEK